jgi:hypothetical protein
MDPRRRALLAALAAGALGTELRPALAQAPLSRNIPSTGEVLPLFGVGTWLTFDVGTDS